MSVIWPGKVLQEKLLLYGSLHDKIQTSVYSILS